MYSMGACAVLRMTNQDALKDNLKSDPFLNFTLQRFTCELHVLQIWLVLRTHKHIGLITSRHYLSERSIKNGGTNGDDRSHQRTAGNSE